MGQRLAHPNMTKEELNAIEKLSINPDITIKQADKGGAVSRRGSVLNTISTFLDRVLRQFAIGSKSYIRETSDFFNQNRELEVYQRAPFWCPLMLLASIRL